MSSAGDIIQPRGVGLPDKAIFIDATAPTVAKDGDVWFNTATRSWNIKVSGVWQPAMTGGPVIPPPNAVGDFLVAVTGPQWGSRSIQLQSVNINTPGGPDVGTAAASYIAANAPFTGDIVIATFGVPAQAYVLINKTAPGIAASWTSLGGAVAFASDQEVLAGVDTIKAINPDGLESRLVQTPDAVPANDARHVVMLKPNGKIDSGFLEVEIADFKGTVDLTSPYVAPTPPWKAGDYGIATTAGAIDPSWNAVGPTGTAKQHDLIFFDGTNYLHITSDMDPTAYVAKAGANAIGNDMIMTWAAPAALTVVIDGADPSKSAIDNMAIDCGTF